MCSQCISMLIPFSHTTNTQRVNRLRLGELPSGESTFRRNDPIPRRHQLGLYRSVVCSLTAYFARLSQQVSCSQATAIAAVITTTRKTKLNLKIEEICCGGSAQEESSTWLRRLFQQHLECYKINCIRTQEQYHARLDSNYLENTKCSSRNTNKTHNALWVTHLAYC